VNFVGTLPRRYVTGEDERWRVGKILRLYKIYPRINAIEYHVAALDARKRKNSRFSRFFRNHEYKYVNINKQSQLQVDPCPLYFCPKRSRKSIGLQLEALSALKEVAGRKISIFKNGRLFIPHTYCKTFCRTFTNKPVTAPLHTASVNGCFPNSNSTLHARV